MKNHILCVFFFLLPFSCTKEEGTLEISSRENAIQIEAYKKHVRNSPRNKDLNPKLVYKKLQKTMRDLGQKSSDNFLIEVCNVAKKIKLLDPKEFGRRNFLAEIGSDEIFPLGVFFMEKPDTFSFFPSLYDPNTNSIVIFDYKNTNKFGTGIESFVCLYAHEIAHYIGYNNAFTEDEDHQKTGNLERSVLLSFFPEILDSLKLHFLWGDDSTARKFIDEHLANSGEIMRENAKVLYQEMKIFNIVPHPLE